MSPTVRSCFLLLFASLQCVSAVRYVPFTPCPKLFNYFESQTFEVFGAMTFKNDLTGNYDLQVNMSIPIDTDKNIAIRRVTEEYSVQQGQSIEYYVLFPYNHTFPKLTSVTFNGQLFCVGPPEVANEEHGVTALSVSNHLKTTISKEAFERRAAVIRRQQTDAENEAAASGENAKETVSDECGRNIDYVPLVWIGNTTRRGEYPWLVAMFIVRDTYSFQCGGSLVSKNHVITAAHCTKDILGRTIPQEEMVLVMGKHDIRNWVLGSTIRFVKEYFVHPDFKTPADADIAIIVMNKPVTYSVMIRPICLWDEDDVLENIVLQKGTVVGWGKDESGQNWIQMPKQIQLPIVAQVTCLWSDVRYRQLTSERTFCAGYKNENRGPCSGDSGGGFIMYRNGVWKLRGVVSVALMESTPRVCDVNNYIVFSDVPKYATWMKKVMN